MRSRLFIVAAVLVLLFGVVGRVTYERTVNTTTPAYAQVNGDDDSDNDFNDDSASDGQYDDGSATEDQYESDDGSTPRRNRDLIDSGASGPGPVLTLPDGSCIPEYPNKRNGYCYR